MEINKNNFFSLMNWFPKSVSSELSPYVKTIEEEKANWLSHGLGVLIFILAVPLLVSKANETQVWPCLVFGISLLMVYCSSTFYHSLFGLSSKLKARVVDHICIYFLIAGSFTPFILIKLPTIQGLLLLKIIWVLVAVGTVFKLFYTNQFKLASTLAYSGMGMLALFIIGPLSQVLPPDSLKWLKIGGFSYIMGVPFYLWKGLKFNHLYWHLCVLLGSISHYIAVLNML